MFEIKEKFIVDEKGKKKGVILSINDYRKMLARMEELEELKIYDKAKSAKNELLPFDEAMTEIGL